MTYSVEIVEQILAETEDGDRAMPSYKLPREFLTMGEAEEAGGNEANRRKREGRARAFYKIFDSAGRPVRPDGRPVE